MVKKCAFSVAVILLLSSVGSACIGYPHLHIGFGPHLGFGYGCISPMTNCFMASHCIGVGALLPCHIRPVTICGANLVNQHQCQIINGCGINVIANQGQVCIIGP
jgi:hypothetical protein